MFQKLATFVLITFIIISCNSTNQKTDVLLPEIKIYKTDYLKVSELHEIYYQLGGNPEGKPILALHGGPGAGCNPDHYRYFDPDIFHIILHDQRGSGRSRPYTEIQENTTQHLVEDVEKLRQHLKLDKVILFGGSWGSTLALAYAETYPQNVNGMVLRGVFTATRSEIDHFYHGGTALFFPENYQKLMEHIDYPEKKNYPAQLLSKIQNPDSLTSVESAKAWARYELKIAFLDMPDKKIDDILAGWNPKAFSVLENYYMANNCFLEEGQLLNNANKLIDIPTIIVNGRYDLICPPVTAYKLHQKLPKSKLYIVENAGHSTGELLIKKALIKAVKEFE